MLASIRFAMLLSVAALCPAMAPALDPPVATASVPPVVLDPAGDNQPALQAWLDSLPNGSTVTLPAGVWPLNSRLTIHKSLSIQSADPTNPATLKGVGGDGNRHVLEVGDYDADVFVHGVKLTSLIVESAVTGTGIHNCCVVHGDSFTAERCSFKGSQHEGLVVHGDCLSATITDCTAIGCGLGNASYSLSTAGFNAHAHPTLYTRCTADGCGQGFEVDGHGSKLIDCEAKNPPSVGPSIAFNVGSTGLGVYDVELDHCRSFGYPDALIASNGIGRFASLSVHDCLFDGGMATVAGGTANNTNSVPRITPGPDTGQSHVDRNVFIIRAQQYGVLGYNGGPSAGGPAISREPYTFNDNTFFVVGSYTPASPIIFAAGHVDHLDVNRNTVWRLDAAPSRGDFQSFSFQDNAAAPGQPGILTSGNCAFKADGTRRDWSEQREGTAP